MKNIKRALKIHRIFMAQEFKRMMEYKGDFIVGIIGFFLVQLSNLLFLGIIFNQVPTLMGWTVYEVVFIYGLSLIPKGIDHFFFDNLWNIGFFIIRKGDFDKYLTRPVNTLFHVLVEKIQLDALGELIMGIALVCVSIPNIEADWNASRFIAMVFMIPFITLIFTGVKTITASAAFWTKRSGNVIYLFYMFSDFAKYPAAIYNRLVQNIITYIIPFALTSYYPALFILRGENPLFNLGMPVLASAVLMGIGIAVWHRGLRAYESAGS